MKNKLLLTLACSAMALSIVQPALSSELNFNAEDSCTLILKQQKQTAGVWAFGYLAGRVDSSLSLDDNQINALTSDLSDICLQSSDATFFAVVEQHFGFITKPADEPAMAAEATPDSADPQSLLDKFADGERTLSEVLISFKPTPEDVRTIFPEPMASNLIEMYEDMYGERLANEEFPSPYTVGSSNFTTTMGLANDPILDEISGGFKRVTDKFLVDVPWATVKILFPSEDDSMSLHGMIFVNDRWVLMMRPWRGLDD
ncbi:MAG: hypothetical protein L3J13_04495 [Devosiaceae bacterium]|nr:hypothetical protein [Devosiaceae bacterium]